jgi:cytoskeletal protein CcmA (bactofilin family)
VKLAVIRGDMPFWKPREEASPDPYGPTVRDEPEPSAPKREESKPMAMLKRDEITSSPAVSSDLNALLGRGSEFEGKLTFEGTVRIDGKFTGSIVTGDVLVVGEGAKISAEVTCGTIIIHGEVNGNIRAKNAVELHHPAKMRGNIESPSLVVEKGVIFEGQSKMENLAFDKPGFDKPGHDKPGGTKGAPGSGPPPIAAVKS